MKGIFCLTYAQDNTAYREIVRGRMKRFAVLFAIGLLTALLGFGAELSGFDGINQHMLGVYSGVGCGLMGASVALWIKNRLLLKDDAKLKASRINQSDERNTFIAQKAFRLAATVLLLAVYVMGLVGGLFMPILTRIMLGLTCLFLVVYAGSYYYLERH